MISSEWHVELNGVRYRLAEDAEGQHYIMSGEPLRPANYLTVQGENQPQFQMRPDVLLWSITDWSGGEGLIRFDPEQSNRARRLSGVDVFRRPGELRVGPYLGTAMVGDEEESAEFLKPVHLVRDAEGVVAFDVDFPVLYTSDDFDEFFTYPVTMNSVTGGVISATGGPGGPFFIEEVTGDLIRLDDRVTGDTTVLVSALAPDNAHLAELGPYVYAAIDGEGIGEYAKTDGTGDIIMESADAWSGLIAGDARLWAVGSTATAAGPTMFIYEIIPTTSVTPGHGFAVSRIPGVSPLSAWFHSGTLYVIGYAPYRGTQLFYFRGGNFGVLGDVGRFWPLSKPWFNSPGEGDSAALTSYFVGGVTGQVPRPEYAAEGPSVAASGGGGADLSSFFLQEPSSPPDLPGPPPPITNGGGQHTLMPLPVPYPSGTLPGDLLVMYVRFSVRPSGGIPGWTLVESADIGDFGAHAVYRRVVGSVGSSFNLPAGSIGVAQVYRFRGALNEVEASFNNSGSAATPALTPSWGSASVTWITGTSWSSDIGGNQADASGVTDYSHFFATDRQIAIQRLVDPIDAFIGIATVRRLATTSSQDPGDFVVTGLANQVRAFTIGVRSMPDDSETTVVPSIYEFDTVNGGFAELYKSTDPTLVPDPAVLALSNQFNQYVHYMSIRNSDNPDHGITLYGYPTREAGHVTPALANPGVEDNELLQPYAITPWNTYGTVEPKVLSSLDLTCEPLPDGWTIFIDAAIDGNDNRLDWNTIAVYDTPSGQGRTFKLNELMSEINFKALSLRVRFLYTGDETPAPPTFPVVTEILARAQIVNTVRTWNLLLDLADDRNGVGQIKVNNLRSIAALQGAVLFRDGYTSRTPGESEGYTVVLDAYDIILHRGNEGVAQVRLRETA